MGNWQWLLDLVVAVLLAATLLRARRLEHALDALRRDRGEFATLLGGAEGSTRQAREAIDELRALTEGAGRRIEQQSATAMALQDELIALIGRGERLAERLDHAARALPAGPTRPGFPGSDGTGALAGGRATSKPHIPALAFSGLVGSAGESASGSAAVQRVRSKAERDLLVALQAGR